MVCNRSGNSVENVVARRIEWNLLGNLHILSGPHLTQHSLHVVEDLVYRATAHVKGSISAEHGIGVVKKDYWLYSRSFDEVDLIRQIKHLLDPLSILNQGRIFDYREGG
ncbi:hypothetical protein KOE80_07195 [Alcaligenes sp. 13f]|uniref:FAD-binding oxidoreductase n=1 Tax=Alcaligenes sp. 13f TaxID=2841924 RepID=UPI001CF665C4|nr:FAD-linked oxidase C-terminal domain-containing protein [Alcaligenes sp. 13f]MCB4321982.1 hypothetical protein [Alcaligenes sp. 13f]